MSRNLAGSHSVFWVALLSTTFIYSSVLLRAQDMATAENPAKACASTHKKDEAKVGKYVFRTYLSDDGACLQVVRDGKPILRNPIDSHLPYSLGQHENTVSKIPAIPNGMDLTGGGHPEMIISQYSGGMHCCTERNIYELEPEFKQVAAIDDQDFEDGHFEDLDHNGHYYYLTADPTFLYWNAAYVDSVWPGIILQFVNDSKGGAFHLALKKMHTPDPTPEQWGKITTAARKAFGADNHFSNGIGSWFWGNILDLIYTGHSDLAWKLCDETWPPERQARICFLLTSVRNSRPAPGGPI
jgi:hypothetical protein